jgi:hypothetical protein
MSRSYRQWSSLWQSVRQARIGACPSLRHGRQQGPYRDTRMATRLRLFLHANDRVGMLSDVAIVLTGHSSQDRFLATSSIFGLPIMPTHL